MRTRIANAVAGMAVAVVAGCSATPPSPSQGPVPTPSSLPSGVAEGSAPPTAGPTSNAAPDYELAYGNPQPVDVSVQLSAITFTTPVTTEHGGFLALAGADGTFYQLDIPPNAV